MRHDDSRGLDGPKTQNLTGEGIFTSRVRQIADRIECATLLATSIRRAVETPPPSNEKNGVPTAISPNTLESFLIRSESYLSELEQELGILKNLFRGDD